MGKNGHLPYLELWDLKPQPNFLFLPYHLLFWKEHDRHFVFFGSLLL